METISEAKKHLRENFSEGVTCPCCSQLVRLYKRRLNSPLARAILWLTSQVGRSGEWIDVPQEAPEWMIRSREYPKLRWWGLLERRPQGDSGERFSSGQWRPTVRGIEFSLGLTTVPEYVYHFDGRVFERSTEQIGIQGSLGERFEFTELFQEFFNRGSLHDPAVESSIARADLGVE